MKRKKLLFIFIVAGLAIAIGFIVSQKSTNNHNQEIESHALFVDHYYDVDSMVKAADIIVTGKVVDAIPERRYDLVLTRQKVEVTKVYRGKVSIGDVISVFQIGGQMGDMSSDAFDEIPLFKKGNEYVLFLRYSEEGHYNIQGGYQGAGTVVGDKVQFSRFKHDNIAKALSGKTLAALDRIIEEKVSLIHK